MSQIRPPDAGPPLDRVRVLVVVPRTADAEALARALGWAPVVVRVCPDEGGSRALADWRPDLLVVPLDDRGDQLLERLSSPPHRVERIPTIALTRRRDVAT